MRKSELFEAYRTIGHVADSTPFHIKRLGTENFVTVSIGKSWQVFNCDKLRVTLVGPAREGNIASVASLKDLTFTAVGRDIIVFKRMEEVARLRGHKGNVYLLAMVGPTLLSVCDHQVMCVWDVKGHAQAVEREKQEDAEAEALIKDEDEPGNARSFTPPRLANTIHMQSLSSLSSFSSTSSLSSLGDRTITHVMHPQTYLNKIVVSFSTGDMELWNFRTGKRIYSFQNVVKRKGNAQHKKNNGHSSGGSSRSVERSLLAKSGTDVLYSAEELQRIDQNETGAIMMVAKSPAVDVVGVAYENGNICVHNLKFDESVVMFRQPEGVCSLSFRTDGFAFLATGSKQGHIAVWDLEKKKLHTVLRDCHSGPITSLDFLASEPVLVSCGTDNALKMWIFDQADGSARLLRQREGHSAPPTTIRFYDKNEILSAGQDQSLRLFHTVREQKNCELSQGSLAGRASKVGVAMQTLRLPPILDFASSPVKARDWANIVSVHRKDGAVYTWHYNSRSLGKHKLVNERVTAPATATCLSACGNFALVGLANGRIEKFNVQSGFFRGRLGARQNHTVKHRSKTSSKMVGAVAAAEAARGASGGGGGGGDMGDRYDEEGAEAAAVDHTGAVVGLAVDGLNRICVSAGRDGCVKFWDMHSLDLIKTLPLPRIYGTTASSSSSSTASSSSSSGLAKANVIDHFCFSVDADLVCCATDDGVLHVIDIHTRKVVRRFKGLVHRLTAMSFSADSRYLVAAQVDGGVRVYDLPSGRLVDWFAFTKPVVSLAFSSDSAFLATAHTDSIGIFLWVNRAHFSNVYLRKVPSRPARMDMPATGAYSTESASETSRINDQEQARAREVAEEQHRKRRRRGGDTDDARASKRSKTRQNARGKSDNDSDSDRDSETESAAGLLTEDSLFGVVDFAAGGQKPTQDQMLSDTGTPLLTLSSLPKSRWQQLPFLEMIRERNKPKEAPKAPANAPFFLSVTQGLAPQLDPTATMEQARLADEENRRNKEEKSRLLRSRGAKHASHMMQLMHTVSATLAGEADDEDEDEDEADEDDEDEDEDEDDVTADAASRSKLRVCVNAAVEYLKSLPPSAIDAEVRSLGIDMDGEKQDLEAVINFLLLALETKKDFEFLQAFMNLFLNVHAENVVKHAALVSKVRHLKVQQKETWRQLEQIFNLNLCLVSHFSNSQM